MDAPCIAILGPTGSGKSEVALRLAEELDGEIISCDSMQVYKGMDIGTAKPSSETRARIPHYFIDCLDISESCTVEFFLETVRPLIRELQERNKTVILAGGSGLYAKALIYDFNLEPSDSCVFREVYEEYHVEGGEQRLTDELREVFDAATLAPFMQNPRRLMRAVEVYRLTGKLPTHGGRQPRESSPPVQWHQFVLMPPTDEYHRKVEERTEVMLNNGWIEEVKGLTQRGFLETPTARQALGYPEICSYLSQGVMDFSELKRNIVSKTLQYGRRQRTWFRRQHPGAYLLTLRHGIGAAPISEAVKAVFGQRGYL